MGPDRDPVEKMLAQDSDIRALARRLVADPDDAADLAQDAWLVASARQPAGQPAGGGWLAQVVRNLSLHFRRAAGRRDRRERAAARPEALPSTADAVLRLEMRRRLIDAVLALEEPLRSAVILRHFENLPPRKIAAHLGIPVETVRSRLKRACAQLRAKLDSEFGGDRRSWLVPIAALGGLKVTGVAASAVAISSAGSLSVALGAIAMKTKWVLASLLLVLALGSAVWIWTIEREGADQKSAKGRTLAAAPLVALASESRSVVASAHPAEAIVPAPYREAPESNSAAVTYGSVAVKVVWQIDRAPAADVQARLIAWADPDGASTSQFSRTDALGACRFDRVLAGTVTVSCLPSGGTKLELKPGQAAEVLVEIPEGTLVTGRVLSSSRAPVAGAEIWLAQYAQWEGGMVTRSRPDGSFSLRGLASGASYFVCARAPEFSASAPHRIRWNMDPFNPVELVLGDLPGTIRGIVTASDGSTVSGASVFAGSPGFERLDQGRGAPPLPSFRTTTDAQGRFQIDGVPPGEASLIVRMRGHPPWRRLLTVVGGETCELRAVLKTGGTIDGTVVDDDRRPVPAIIVRTAATTDWLAPSAKSDQDGHFRMEGLEPGTVEILALGGEALGTASATIVAEEGATVPVSLVLSRGLTITGHVVDARGAPIPGCGVRIDAFHDGVSDDHKVITGKNGEFTALQCKDVDHVLFLEEKGSRFPSLRMENVRPSTADLLLKLEDAVRPNATVKGMLVDADHMPLPVARVCLMVPHGNGACSPTQTDGSFTVGTVPAGTYVVSVTLPGSEDELYANAAYEREITLTASETHDLGVVVLQTRVVVRLLRDDGKPLGEVSGSVWFGGSFGGGTKLTTKNGLGVSGPVPAGSHELVIGGETVMPVRIPIQVLDGEETRLDVHLQSGIAHELELTDESSDLGQWASATISITGSNGGCVLKDRRRWSAKRTLKYPLVLAPGIYQLDATSSSGRSLTTTFTTTATAKPLAFTLK